MSVDTGVDAASTDLGAREARRIFLAAQSLAGPRPRRRARPADIARYLEHQGVLQLDTVNVLARAHYLPFYSRLGPYDTAMADHVLWGHEAGHAAEAFEHWGHEASVMPHDLLPLMHHRMVAGESWKARTRAELEAAHPGLIAAVQAAVEEHGPVIARDLEHLASAEGPRGPWWDQGLVKRALEYLFMTGGVAASRGRHFARTYDSTARAWELSPASAEGDWGLSADDARQALFDRAIAACGIGTPRDLADHFRLRYQAGPKTPDVAGAKAWAASAVERGIATWVSVEGWGEPALLAAGAADPGRAGATALLSPFDPVCWFRPRLKRMFDVDYRIEIYTPEPQRQFGYYCLPLLVGDQIPARFDLKADRKAGALLVQASWREPGRAPGARRLPDSAVARAAARELTTMARWLGLESVSVAPRGDLAPALASALVTRLGDANDAALG
ncbi:winged helix-turn-helix domain-containing protein [Demequina sp. NBRC 110057]|uniref:winged helix-turn-helix domain-containing protein n=1 Tax=Demequina sp. NBRC 110057 TaxID=1570346 RepID=UPI0009FBDAEF|nr:crosslink repair DNA glycosylase YcaQ family protein [Demequina sp. NBRC 110057]